MTDEPSAVRRSVVVAGGREDAELLAVPVGSPVLRCARVTSGVDGRPLLVSVPHVDIPP